jgi:hypothetical protein
MLPELGMVLGDPGYRLADCASHTDSSPLGRGCGSSIATTQAHRARELSTEEVAFGVGLRSPLERVSDGGSRRGDVSLGQRTSARDRAV